MCGRCFVQRAAIATLAMLLVLPAAAFAQSSPWERAANNLALTFTGPLARSLALVAIVIGGPDGFNEDVGNRAQKRWRLSRLTVTHEMARVLAVEQLYRAYTINRGLPYQK